MAVGAGECGTASSKGVGETGRVSSPWLREDRRSLCGDGEKLSSELGSNRY